MRMHAYAGAFIYQKEAPVARLKLHGPLDGLLKAHIDTSTAELTLSYAGETVILDNDDLDRLLRVSVHSRSTDQAEADLAEFFEAEVSITAARRMALWFVANDQILDTHCYA